MPHGIKETAVVRHIRVGMKADVRSLEELQPALEIAADDQGLGQVEQLVGVGHGDVDQGQALERLRATFEPIDERQQLAGIRAAAKMPSIIAPCCFASSRSSTSAHA